MAEILNTSLDNHLRSCFEQWKVQVEQWRDLERESYNGDEMTFVELAVQLFLRYNYSWYRYVWSSAWIRVYFPFVRNILLNKWHGQQSFFRHNETECFLCSHNKTKPISLLLFFEIRKLYLIPLFIRLKRGVVSRYLNIFRYISSE